MTTNETLPERLRRYAKLGSNDVRLWHDLLVAADRIEELEAERPGRLRRARVMWSHTDAEDASIVLGGADGRVVWVPRPWEETPDPVEAVEDTP